MPIDLRSDTVTLPSPDMRQAIASAVVGDDVYGEDPTVNELEALSAKMLGKEAGLFVASGTQGNLASLLAHCGRGQEIILGDQSHIYYYENAGASALGGVAYRPVPTARDGTLPLDTLEAAIHSPAHNYHFFHYAPAGVICLENTHNRCGGVVLTPEYFSSVGAIAAGHGLPIHLDGARLFNAAVALRRPITDWTRHVSSVQLCLSKGLGAPVGSVIVGSETFIWHARRMRKILGGGMRQAGIIAAGGLFALTHMVDRLADDHANAQILAAGIEALPGVTLDPPHVQTNIVVFNVGSVETAKTLAAALEREGVLVSDFGGGRLRFVTHYGITADDCHRAVAALRKAYNVSAR